MLEIIFQNILLKLKPKILGWKKDYDKAARCASFGIGGSKRSKCRAEMKRIMGIMHNANANLELYQANTKNSQAFANGKRIGVVNE